MKGFVLQCGTVAFCSSGWNWRGTFGRGVERPHGRHGEARGGLWTSSEPARKAAWATLPFERRLLLASGRVSRWPPSRSAAGALSTGAALPGAARRPRLPLLMFVVDFPWFTVSDQVTSTQLKELNQLFLPNLNDEHPKLPRSFWGLIASRLRDGLVRVSSQSAGYCYLAQHTASWR